MKRAQKAIRLTDREEVKSRYFGVDLHKDQITFHCIVRFADGAISRTNGRVATGRLSEDFVPLLDPRDSYLIVEASCSTFFFYSLVEAHCREAIAINPLAFRELFMSGKKTDRIDAKKLADRLMYHIEMADSDDGFPEVVVPDSEVQQLRKLISTYELVVKQSTQVKNHFKAIFRAKLIEVDAEPEGSIESLLGKANIDETDRLTAETLKAVFDSLVEQKERIKEAIHALGLKRFRQEVTLLSSINGVSVTGSIVFMADIITVDRFGSAKNLTSYLASVGKVDASGQTTHNGGLNKRGRRTSYRFILQGLEHVVKGNKNFLSFRERHTSKRSNKVRAAIVRKTFVTMYYMLKNNEEYRFVNQLVYKRKLKEIEKILQKAA